MIEYRLQTNWSYALVAIPTFGKPAWLIKKALAIRCNLLLTVGTSRWYNSLLFSLSGAARACLEMGSDLSIEYLLYAQNPESVALICPKPTCLLPFCVCNSVL